MDSASSFTTETTLKLSTIIIVWAALGSGMDFWAQFCKHGKWESKMVV